MNPSSPFLTLSNTVLWLKVALTAATLVLLYLRYRAWKESGGSPKASGLRTKLAIGFVVLFAFGVFHNLGTLRGGNFVHYAEMFHYYLGPKYFKELGYYELYNAVIAADTEQGNALANLPFYTDLRTYQNTQRATALRDVDRVKGLFSEARWSDFKADVAFFKKATGMPKSPGLFFLLMDHGYNASPISTFVLSVLTNLVPAYQMWLLAGIDVFLVIAMVAIVFSAFGFEMGALFSVYFFVNILSGHEYISGSLLRYDWLLYIVAAVCLLHKGRYASSAFFLTLSAMMRIFPAVLFYGVAVTIFRKVRTTGTLDKQSMRFIATAGVTALVLFLLPAVSFGSVVQPWKDFFSKTSLHDSGVYVNHIGLRGVVLFEPSHLSLESFAERYKSADIVRHWQDVKEHELRGKRPLIILASLFALACVTAVIWRRKEDESASVVWPLLVVYTSSYLSHYYYAFLCLFVLLFFRQASGFVPLCSLLVMNLISLITDYCKPSPIVFFTSINIYLFLCLSAILVFALFVREQAVSSGAPPEVASRRRRKTRSRK